MRFDEKYELSKIIAPHIHGGNLRHSLKGEMNAYWADLTAEEGLARSNISFLKKGLGRG